MEIQIAAFNDLAEILALQRVAFYDVAVEVNNFMIPPLVVGLEDLEKSFDQCTYLKMMDNGRIIGCARALLEETPEGTTCHIQNVIVHPAHQRKGVGASLIREIETRFANVRRFELFTGKETKGNIAFYTTLGYSIIAEKAATKHSPVFVIMEKVL